MPSDTCSFWDLDLEEESLEETPRQVLTQQARLLGEITSDVLNGIVKTRRDPGESAYLLHDLIVIAPRLDAYRFIILRVSQPLTIYPLEIRGGLLEDTTYECNNIDEFKKDIREILSAEKTKKVIHSLYLQSRDDM